MICLGSLPYCGNIHTVLKKNVIFNQNLYPPIHSSCSSEVCSQECREYVLLFSWNSSLWWQLAYIPLKVFAFLVSIIIPQVTWKCFSILAKLLWTIIKTCAWVYWSRVFIGEQCALLFAWLLLDTGRPFPSPIATLFYSSIKSLHKSFGRDSTLFLNPIELLVI